MERTPKQAEESFAGLLGGARPNSGTPKGYVKSADLKALDKEKARHEKIKADRAELAYKIELGKYLSREAFKQAHATSSRLLCWPQAFGASPTNWECGLASNRKSFSWSKNFLTMP
jgi:hypothetical protein